MLDFSLYRIRYKPLDINHFLRLAPENAVENQRCPLVKRSFVCIREPNRSIFEVLFYFFWQTHSFKLKLIIS